jgi:hypothetical protein
MSGVCPREPPRAKWYVICFHYQMAFLMLAFPLTLVPFAVGNQQRVPEIWIWLLLAVSLPFLGHLGTRTVLHARWLQGVGNHHKPIIGPSSRVNCVMLGCLSVVLILMGVDFVLGVQGNPVLAPVLILGGLFILFASVCGYLWKRDAIRAIK